MAAEIVGWILGWVLWGSGSRFFLLHFVLRNYVFLDVFSWNGQVPTKQLQ